MYDDNYYQNDESEGENLPLEYSRECYIKLVQEKLKLEQRLMEIEEEMSELGYSFD